MQLTRLDRRVVAVLQQHGPLHRAGRKRSLSLVIDNPFDLVKLGPFHGGLHPRCLTPGHPVIERRPHGGFRRGMSVVSAGMVS